MSTYNMTLERSYPTPYSTSPWLYFILASMALQKHAPKTKTHMKEEYDYIIVGAGTAGSVVAGRLSERNCASVLLLEAGNAPPKVSDIPVAANSFIGSDLDWQYRTMPVSFLDGTNRTISLPAGKTIGGTSIFNGMQVVRGNKRDYDAWAANGASGWSYDEVLPYFKKLETNTNPEYVRSGYHGTNGPLTVSRPNYDSALKAALTEAARSMNYRVGDINGPVQEGFFNLQAAMRRGQRCSNAKAYLVPNDNRKNLDIISGAFVRKVLIENREALGVIVDYKSQMRLVRARREVIVSAGAVRSPQLLMLSGIGPARHLTKHNIPVVADLPVGLNLQEHWGVMLRFQLNSSVKPFYDKIRTVENIRKYMQSKAGPLTSVSGVATYGFLHSQNNSTDASLYQIIFGEGSAPPPKQESNTGNNQPFFWCLPLVIQSKQRGRVYLQSNNPDDKPLIQLNYFQNPEDTDTIVEGLKKCKEFGSSAALRKIGSKLIEDIPVSCEKYLKKEDKLLQCIARSSILSSSHLAGTVKMGSMEDISAVLDPQLRVKNIRRLRVVDASVMPTISSGNTNIPTTMIAEKASDMIKEHIICDSW